MTALEAHAKREAVYILFAPNTRQSFSPKTRSTADSTAGALSGSQRAQRVTTLHYSVRERPFSSRVIGWRSLMSLFRRPENNGSRGGHKGEVRSALSSRMRQPESQSESTRADGGARLFHKSNYRNARTDKQQRKKEPNESARPRIGLALAGHAACKRPTRRRRLGWRFLGGLVRTRRYHRWPLGERHCPRDLSHSNRLRAPLNAKLWDWG